PADAGAQFDHPALVPTLYTSKACRRSACRGGLARPPSAGRRAPDGLPPGILGRGREHLVERNAELADDRVERPHGWLRLARLDLRDEARRDLQPAGELAQGQPAAVPLLAQPRAE